MIIQLLLITTLLLGGFDCSGGLVKRKLPFIFKGSPTEKVAPLTDILPGGKTVVAQSAKRSFFGQLCGGKSDRVRVAPGDVNVVKVKKSKANKVSPSDVPSSNTKHLSVIAPEEGSFLFESFKTDATEATSLSSPSTDPDRKKFFANTLSENEVDLLYGDCLKFLKEKKFFIFRYALVKIKSYITNDRLVTLLEEAVKYKLVEYVEFLFEHFDYLAVLPSNVIFLALASGNTRIIDFIIRNRTIEDQHLKDNSRYYPYELAAELDEHEAMRAMLEKWSKTKLAWIPKAINMAISWGSSNALKVIMENLKNDNITTLNMVIDKYVIAGFITKALDRRDMNCLAALIDYLPSNFLDGFNDDQVIHFTLNEVHINPVIKAISVDYAKGLEYMVNHFGLDILKEKDDLEQSAFMVAAHYLSPKCAKYIALVCPDQINSTDVFKNNALHIALITDSPKVRKYFKAVCDIGIDWEAKNFYGLTAFALLHRNRYIEEKDIERVKQMLNEDSMK